MEEGMLLYVGPSPNNFVENVTDFLAIELTNGKLKMFVNFGSGTRVLALEHKVRFILTYLFVSFTAKNRIIKRINLVKWKY